MNIHTVAENLRKTIAGKEAYLARWREIIAAYEAKDDHCDAWLTATVTLQYLDININELKVILFDVEKCCEKATLDSWIINPERMGQ
jgi:hypothetical protein